MSSKNRLVLQVKMSSEFWADFNVSRDGWMELNSWLLSITSSDIDYRLLERAKTEAVLADKYFKEVRLIQVTVETVKTVEEIDFSE